MERLDVLVRQARDQTGNQQYTSTQGIRQREFVRYANDAQMRIYNKILMERSTLYMRVGYIDIEANEAVYDLAEDIFLKHNVSKVDYSPNGDARLYSPLDMRTPRQEVSAPGYPDSYFMRQGEIVISPIPMQSATRGLRLNYQYTIPTLDIRRAQVTETGIGINTFTTNASTGSTNAVSVETNAAGLNVVVGVLGQVSTSPTGEEWTVRAAGFGSSTVWHSAFDGLNTYIATGDSGKIACSTDGGITWNQVTSGTGVTLTKANYAAGLFVVTGTGGVLITSPDGINWTTQTSNLGGATPVVNTYINGMYVVAGTSGAMSTSINGTVWIGRITNFGANTIRAVIYQGGRWMLTGAGGAVCTSPDVSTWTPQVTGFVGGEALGLAYGRGLYVIAGFNNQIFTSPTGVTWTARTSALAPGVYIGGTIFNGTYFYMYDSTGGFAYSRDGITWTSIAITVSNNISFMDFNEEVIMLSTSSGEVVYSLSELYEVVLSGQTDETETDLTGGWVDYITIVDTDGTQLQTALTFESYSTTTGILVVSGVTSAPPLGYLTFGANSTTHSQLPDVAARYLTEYMALRIQMRDSNTESVNTSSVLRTLEEEIIDSIANLEEDLPSIPILDSSMMSYDMDL